MVSFCLGPDDFDMFVMNNLMVVYWAGYRCNHVEYWIARISQRDASPLFINKASLERYFTVEFNRDTSRCVCNIINLEYCNFDQSVFGPQRRRHSAILITRVIFLIKPLYVNWLIFNIYLLLLMENVTLAYKVRIFCNDVSSCPALTYLEQ